MSAKTYVGERVSGDSSVYPTRKYILYPVDGKVEEFTSRLGYPQSGSGPYLSAHYALKRGVEYSTEYCGSCVYAQRSGTSINGSGIAYTGVGRGDRYWYQTYRGYTTMYYETISDFSKAEYQRRSWYITRRRVRYSLSVRTKHRPSWFKAFGFSSSTDLQAGNAAYQAAMSHLGEFTKEFDSVETAPLLTGTITRTLDLMPDRWVLSRLLDTCDFYLTTGILPGSWARGFETAYIEACNSLPQASVNLAANILETASLLTSFITGDVIGSIPKTAQQAWLAYRYQYTTTKMDVSELKSTFSRLDALTLHSKVTAYGSYARGDIRYRVGFDIDSSQILPKDVSDTLQRFGLELNALNVWDMIPYSFIVDWFLPISDIIEYFQSMSGAVEIKPQDLWFSLVTTEGDYEVYVRLPGRKLFTLPYLQIRSASQKTVFMRCADAIALFT